MFAFYFAILSAITPPVLISSIVGLALLGAITALQLGARRRGAVEARLGESK